MTRFKLLFALTVLLLSSFGAIAGAPVVVDQVRRRFSVQELTINRGETIHFRNVDEFLHQIFIDTPTMKFSSNEQSPGQTVDVTFPVTGTFEVRCEIHPKMVMSVKVQ